MKQGTPGRVHPYWVRRRRRSCWTRRDHLSRSTVNRIGVRVWGIDIRSGRVRVNWTRWRRQGGEICLLVLGWECIAKGWTRKVLYSLRLLLCMGGNRLQPCGDL